MKKSTIIVLIVLVLFGSFLLNLLLQDAILARLSTLPIARRYNLFKPQAPIVINERETVRVSDANDAIESANNIKSKLSVVGYIDEDRFIPTGTVLNWTSDGYFVTTQSALSVGGQSYLIITNNGESLAVTTAYPDTASNLVMLATTGKSLPTVSTTDSKELKVGQKLLFIESTLNNSTVKFLQSYVSKVQSDVVNVVFNSDRLTRGFVPQEVGAISPGQAIVNLNSEVVGIWDGEKAIPGSIIRQFANNFFRDGLAVKRAGYGFTYRIVSETESKIINSTLGAQIVTSTGPSLQAGLKVGDIITAVDGRKVSENALLEEILEGYQPGNQVPLSVSRDNQNVNVTITPRQLTGN